MPINPADTYSARLGGIYGPDAATPPFVAGHDGVGVVAKVRPSLEPGRGAGLANEHLCNL